MIHIKWVRCRTEIRPGTGRQASLAARAVAPRSWSLLPSSSMSSDPMFERRNAGISSHRAAARAHAEAAKNKDEPIWKPGSNAGLWGAGRRATMAPP